MSKTIKLDLPATSIEGAARRMTHLLETGYLPASIAADIQTLMHGAMAWEVVNSLPRPDQQLEKKETK